MAKNLFPLVIVIFFAVLSGWGLLHFGLHPTHDGEYHVIRFYEFYEVLRDGNWYPRWARDLNNGYGVPLFNFVYPFPNYVASFLHMLGISFIDAFKLNMFSAAIVGGIFMYLWTRIFWGERGGVVSSVFYLFSPYHFVDIYIRGSVGEVWALAFFPALLWSITNFIKRRQKIFFLLSSIFLGLIVFSHNILALMFFVFLLSYIVFLIFQEAKKKYLILNTLYIILLGLGLSVIFWLPAIFEKQYVVGLQLVDPKDHFPELYQLLFPSWGAGFRGGSLGDQMSFQIGVANLAVFFISILIIVLHILKKVFSWIIIFFVIWFALIFYLMMPASLFIWNRVPLMNYFQFPWRFLSLEILVASFLAGGIVYIFRSSILGIVMILSVFLLGVGYIKPAYYHDRNDGYYTSRSNFMHGTNSLGDAFNTVWFDTNNKKTGDKIMVANGNANITEQNIKTSKYKFVVNAKNESKIQINTAYFPGWKVFLESEEVPVELTKNGLFTFSIPPGQYNVIVQFVNTPIRQGAFIISLISATVVLFIILRYVKIKK